jgi:hypothetical protein
VCVFSLILFLSLPQSLSKWNFPISNQQRQHLYFSYYLMLLQNSEKSIVYD